MKLASLPGLPGIVLEEITHAAVAAPFADVDIRFGEKPPLRFTWGERTPTWYIYLSHLAPTLLGVVLTFTAVITFDPAVVWAVPVDPFTGAALGLLAAYNWLLYVWPSYEDRNPFAKNEVT